MTSSSSGAKQVKIDKFCTMDRMVLSMTESQFKSGLVKMVLGRVPFRFFNTDGFRLINGEMAAKLKENYIFCYFS